MVKKILKIVGIALVVLVASLFAIPYFFKDQIKAKILTAINEKVDAKVAFADADLSLFKNFPSFNASAVSRVSAGLSSTKSISIRLVLFITNQFYLFHKKF